MKMKAVVRLVLSVESTGRDDAREKAEDFVRKLQIDFGDSHGSNGIAVVDVEVQATGNFGC